MPYTKHGHWYGAGAPTAPQPRLVSRCGGPHLCTTCALEAQRAEGVGRSHVPLSPVPSPEDIATTKKLFEVWGKFGMRLGRVCFAAVTELERLAPPAAEDAAAHQRADDDGMPQRE